MRRKLAVIFSSDVAGYSRLVAIDESTAIARFTKLKAALGDLVSAFHGRIFNTAGDAILADFESATDAVRCAIEFQDTVRARNLAFPESQKMLFRIGIAIGDVLVQEDDGDLLGDGVNIAARLQTLSKPGGICISQDVYSYVDRNLSCGVTDLGPQNLKNLTRPIHAYGIELGAVADKKSLPIAATSDVRIPDDRKAAPAPRRRVGPLSISLIALLIAGASIYAIVGPLRSARPPAQQPAAGPAPQEQQTGQQAAVGPAQPQAQPQEPAQPAGPPAPTPAEMISAELKKISPGNDADATRVANEYLDNEDYKALAVAPGGGVWRTRRMVSPQDAQMITLEGCQLSYGKPCLLLAQGNGVVAETDEVRRAPQYMPRIVYSGAYDAAKLPILGPAARVRADVKEYPQINQPKAMAIHPLGRVTVATASTTPEAEAKALAACDSLGSVAVEGPCRTYALDNQVVLPQRRALAR